MHACMYPRTHSSTTTTTHGRASSDLSAAPTGDGRDMCVRAVLAVCAVCAVCAVLAVCAVCAVRAVCTVCAVCAVQRGTAQLR